MHRIQGIDASEEQKSRTHYAVIEDTMEQVDKLNQVFGEFLNRKKLLSKSPHSLNLPDGI